MVGMWSVHVIGMSSVCGRYVIDMCSVKYMWLVKAIGMCRLWLVCGRYVVGILVSGPRGRERGRGSSKKKHTQLASKIVSGVAR